MSFLRRLTKFKIKPSKKLKFPSDNSWAIIANDAPQNIFNKLPKNLTPIEKMYYFYMELGAISNQNLRFYCTKYKYPAPPPKTSRRRRIKKKKLNTPTHSLVHLNHIYISLLKRANIPFTYNIVKEKIKSFIPYTYLFITLDNKTYALNIYQDLELIQKSRRTKKFAGFTTTFVKISNEEKKVRLDSIESLEKIYGPFYQLPRADIKKIEALLNYNHFNKINYKRPVLIEDLIQMMKHDLEDLPTYRNYILAGRTPEPHAEIRYALGFILRHLKAQCDILGLNSEERLEYFKTYIFELLPKKDCDRIKIYDFHYSRFGENILSIIRINNDIYPDSEAERPYTIYAYIDYLRTYKKITPRDVYIFKKNLQFIPHKIIEYKNESQELITKDLDLLHGIKLINVPEDEEIHF